MVLKKKDLKILNYLLEELKELDHHTHIDMASLPNWYMEELKIEEQSTQHYREVKRLFNIFQVYGLGEFTENKGFLLLSPTHKTHDDSFNEFYKTQKEKEDREAVEFEKLSLDVKLNKWLLKSKWLPHILASISIIISVISFLHKRNMNSEIQELRMKIEEMENVNDIYKEKIDLLENNNE